jgi:hypothetical protein
VIRFKDGAARVLSPCTINRMLQTFKPAELHGVKRAYFLKNFVVELSFTKSSACMKSSAQYDLLLRLILSHFNPVHIFTPCFPVTHLCAIPPALSSGLFHSCIPTNDGTYLSYSLFPSVFTVPSSSRPP